MSENFFWNDDNSRRAMVDEGRQALERTSASIARSNQIAIETEQIGTEVLGDLGEQRESLLRSNRRLENTNEELSQAQKALRAIGKNVLYNKLTLILIIIVEILILSGLCYLRFAK